MKKILLLFPILSFLFIVNVSATTLDYDYRTYFALIRNDNNLLNNVVSEFESTFVNDNDVYCFVRLVDSSVNVYLTNTYIYFNCIYVNEPMSIGYTDNFYVNDGYISNNYRYRFAKISFYTNGGVVSRNLYNYSNSGDYFNFSDFLFLIWYKSNNILTYNNVFIPNNLSNDYYVNLLNDYNSNKNSYINLYGNDYLYYNSSDRWYSLAEKVLAPSPTDYEYTIKYYFNDILDNTLTEELTYTGYENDVVSINPELILNGYDLVSDTYQYVAGGTNVINIYYRNEMYHKQYYTINVYLDDIYYKQYSYTNYGEIGSSVVLDLPNSYRDIYEIDDVNYDFVINEDVNLNEFSVNYYSEYYGTEYQLVDLTDRGVYLFFTFDDLLRVFPHLDINHFTQYQQLVLIFSINIFFVIFLLFIFILVYRLLQKVLSYFF